MEQSKVDALMAIMGPNIPVERHAEIIGALQNAPDEKYALLVSIPFKNPTTITLLSVFLGGWGIDRFMLGDIGLGVLKLLTGGLCGIMWFIDLFIVGKRARMWNYTEAVKRLM